jgi:hypothetical protein
MDTCNSISFYFERDLDYMTFITEATKLLHHNSSFGTVCLVVAHGMWLTYRTKIRTMANTIVITLKQKDFQDLKPPSCPSLWIMCEHAKSIVSYPNTNPSTSCGPAVDIVRKQTNISGDFEFWLVATGTNPVSALATSNIFRASKV